MKAFVFKVKLLSKGGRIFDEEIWRVIEVYANSTLYTFARAITNAFGFYFDHPFGFYSNLKGPYHESEQQYELFKDIGEESEADSVKRTVVSEVFRPGDKMLFSFDYGDDWCFEVEHIDIVDFQYDQKYPRTSERKGAAPPQYD